MRKILTILIFVLFTQSAKSQLVVLEDSTNLNTLFLSECGSVDTVTTYIRLLSGTLSGTVNFFDTFNSNFVIVGVVSNPVVSTTSNFGTNYFSCTLNPSVIALAGNRGVLIKILVKVKCGSNGITSAFSNMSLKASNYQVLKIGQDLVSAIKAPVVLLSSTNGLNNTNAKTGNTYTRQFKIQNSGVQSTLDTFYWESILQPNLDFLSLNVNGTLVSPTLTTGLRDTVRYKIIYKLRSLTFFPGDSVSVIETYKVKNCTNSGVLSQFSVSWGCFNEPKCNQSLIFGNVSVPNTVPNVTWDLFQNKINNQWNTRDTMVIRIINNSTVEASNVFFSVATGNGLDHLPSSNTTNSRLDTNQMFYKTGINGTWINTVKTNYEEHTAFNSWYGGFKGAHRVDLQFGTLNANDTIFVNIPYYKPSPSAAGKNNLSASCGSASDHYWGNYKGQVGFSNICNTINYTSNSTSKWMNGRYSFLLMNNQALVAPTDVNDGDSFTVDLNENYFVRSINSSIHSYFFVRKIKLPSGLIYKGSNPLYFGPSNEDTLSYDSAKSTIWIKFSSKSNTSYKLPLKVNCSNGSGIGDFTDQLYLMPANYCTSGCDTFYFSAPCKRSINVHCSYNCARGGWSPLGLECYRVNFGKPDNNNDKLPDLTGSIDLTKVNSNLLLAGDTLEIKSSAIINVGPKSPGNFIFGYASIVMPNNWFSGTTADVYIVDTNNLGASASYTIPNLPVTTTVVGSNTIIRLDFSVHQLTSGSVPPGFQFGQNDFVMLKIRAASNSNTPNTLDINSYVFTDSIYISHQQNPALDSAKYFCNNYSGTWNLVGSYRFSSQDGSGGINVNGCDGGEFLFRTYQRFGGNYPNGNTFPYEYRPISIPDTFYFDLPANFAIKKSKVYWRFSAGNFEDSLTLTRKSGNRHFFAIRQLIKGFGGTREVSDEGDYVDFGITLVPTCETTLNSITGIPFGQNWISARPEVTNWGTGSNPVLYNAEGTGGVLYPKLDIANLGAKTAYSTNKTIKFDFKVQNNTLDQNSPFTYVTFKSKKGTIVIDSVKQIGFSTNLSSTNNIYKLGNVVSGGIGQNYSVFTRPTNCLDDTIIAYLGWDCLSYPTSINNIKCKLDSVTFYTLHLSSVIQTSLVKRPPNMVGLCDTLNWELNISNRQQSAAFDLKVDIELPNSGIGTNVIPIYAYKYPSTDTVWKSIQPQIIGIGKYRFFLSDSILLLKNNGLRSIYENPFNEVLLKIKVITNCNFVSGSSIKFIARANRGCGSPIQPDVEASGVRIIGAPLPELHLIKENIPAITACDSSVIISMQVNNYENVLSDSTDEIWISLPISAEFVLGSTSFNRNKFTNIIPKLDTVNGRQRLKWTTDSIPAFDSALFTFKYRSPSNTPCTETQDFKLQSVSKFKTFCKSVLCESYQQNELKDIDKFIFKPNIRYNLGSGYVNHTNDTSTDIYATDTFAVNNLEFENFGNENANKLKITYYYDDNHNNKFDGADSIWALDSILNIMPGSKRLYSKMYTCGTTCLPDTIKISAFQKCNCNASEFAVNPITNMVSLQMNWAYFNAIKVKEGALINWAMLNEEGVNYYTIERFSNEESTFKTISTLSSKTNTNSLPNYSFIDTDIKGKNGIFYYRIKAVSKNGISFTDVRIVENMDVQNGFSFWPNPAQNEINIVSTLSQKNFLYTLNQMDGKLIKSGQCLNGNCTISIADVPAGIYILSVHNGKQLKPQKIIIY